MSLHPGRPLRAASAPILALVLAAGFAYLTPANRLWSVSAQVTSPHGSYGIIANQWQDPSNGTSTLLGSLNFDGAGNVNGEYTIVNKNYAVLTGTLAGAYSGNPDGSNIVKLTFDSGGTLAAAIAVTDGGSGLQLLVTGGTAVQPGVAITGTGRSQTAPGTMPAGSYGYLLNRWPDANKVAQGVLGMLNLDGAGNLTGSYTAVSTNIGPAPISGTFTGTYSTNPDGTGKVVLNLDLGFSLTFSIVVTDGGAGLLMLQTDESDGFGQVFAGTARRQ